MPGQSKVTSAPPGSVEDALRQVGENIRIARTRRRLRLEDVARKIGVSRLTLAAVEKGKPGASAAAYFSALWALGLIRDAYGLADPDGDALTYAATSSNSAIAKISVSGSTVTITAVAAGRATLTVTARDPDGLTAQQQASVTVTSPDSEAVVALYNATNGLEPLCRSLFGGEHLGQLQQG